MTSIPASHLDLVQTAGAAALSTTTADGLIQVTAVWFLLDDDGSLKVSLNEARQKTKNLRRNPAATLFFIDPANQFRTLEVRGTVEFADDHEYAFADRVGAKYGADLRTMDQPGEHRVVVTLEAQRINTNG
jgi:PPOX class probable F420-dependent enzyme